MYELATLVFGAINVVANVVSKFNDAVGPQLQIDLRTGYFGTTREDSNAHHYRHLRISNRHRSRPAHDVQVFVTRVEEILTDKTVKVLMGGEEVRMIWQWEKNDPTSPKTRTVGAPATCDLLAVVKATENVRIQTTDDSWYFRFDSLQKGHTYVLTFVARSDENDSPPFRVQIHWDGVWTDDEEEFSDHLSVKEVPGYLVHMPP